MSSLNREIFKKSIILTILGILGQIFNFLTTLLIASIFGSNWVTDAYFLAFSVTVTFVTIIAGVIKIVFIPFMVEEQHKNPEEIPEFVGSTLVVVAIASGISMSAVFLLSQTDSLFVSNHQEGTHLVRKLILELSPIIPLMMFSAIFNAIYNSYQRFGLAEGANVLKNFFIILALLLCSRSLGIHGLALGNLLGQAISLILFILMFYKRLGLVFRFRWPWSPTFKTMLRESVMPFFTVVFAQFHPLTANIVASMLDEGSISTVNYAQRIAMIPMIVLGTGFSSVLLSYWSKSSVEDDQFQLQNSLNRSISMMFTLLTPIVLVLFLLREPLTRLLFHRGKFSAQAVFQTANLSAWFVVAVFPSYVQMIVVRILVAKKDTFALLWISALIFLFNPAISYILAVKFGFGASGIAISTLVSNLIVFFATAAVVHKKFVKLEFKKLSKNISISSGACLVTAFAISLFKQKFDYLFSQANQIVEICMVSFTAFLVYGVCLRILLHPDFSSVQNVFYSYCRKSKDNLSEK